MSQSHTIPKVLWLAIVSLAIFSIFHLVTGFSKPVQFFALAINIVLIFGLLRLAKWAYFLAILASLCAPFVLSFEGTMNFYIILILNCTVLIPVLICTKAFFVKSVDQQLPA